MRVFLTLLLISGISFGQTADTRPKLSSTQPATAPQNDKNAVTSAPAGTSVAEAPDPHSAIIPAGTKVPLLLKQAISTKNAREGDPVYAETAFPYVLNDRILIPAGTYIQGKIMHTEHAGRSQKRAELLIHFTSMIYPSGYTVMLPGSVDNTPGADDKSVKDSEGTIQQDKDTGKRVEDAARDAAVAGTVGGIAGAAAGGLNGARFGGLAGVAGGVAWAL